MTRDEVLAQCRPIRAGIQRVLRLAETACRPADLSRAVKQVAPWAEAKGLEDAETGNMLVEVALFEPNQRGRRAFDRFLEGTGEQLGAADRALAERMAGAWFSLFRLAGRHEVAGLWLEDLLGDNRRLWLMGEGLETSAPEELVLGMRLFDAGLFHAGLGIIVAPDEETRARRGDDRVLPAGQSARRSAAGPAFARRDPLRRSTAGRCTARSCRPGAPADPVRDPHLSSSRPKGSQAPPDPPT